MRQFKNIIYTKPHFLLNVTTCWFPVLQWTWQLLRVEISSSDNIVSFFLSILVISDWCLKYQVWSVDDSILFSSHFQVTAHETTFLSWVSDSCVSGSSKPLIFFLECLPKLNFLRIIDQAVASDYTKFLSNLQFFSWVIEVFSDWWIFKPALEELDEMKFTPKFPQEVGNKTEQNRAIVTIPVTYFCFPPHIVSLSYFSHHILKRFRQRRRVLLLPRQNPCKKGKRKCDWAKMSAHFRYP